MIEKLQNKINEDLMKMPKEKQLAINNFDWIKKAEDIGRKFLLTEKEITTLQSETWLVLLGSVNLDKYTQNIEDNIGVTNDDSKGISEQIFINVFSPIAKYMEEVVKNESISKNSKWDATVKFIISGGDYSNFIKK